jgi:hypothetical protein
LPAACGGDSLSGRRADKFPLGVWRGSRKQDFRHIETVWFDAPAANGAVIGRKP